MYHFPIPTGVNSISFPLLPDGCLVIFLYTYNAAAASNWNQSKLNYNIKNEMYEDTAIPKIPPTTDPAITPALDVDECDNDILHTCNEFATCINNNGSYNCSCNANYTGDGINCVQRVKGKKLFCFSFYSFFKNKIVKLAYLHTPIHYPKIHCCMSTKRIHKYCYKLQKYYMYSKWYFHTR